VREILQVIYYDEDGQSQVISPNDYVVDVSGVPARLKFNLNVSHKSARAINGYEIDFVAGFGSTTLDIPHDLRHAILMLVTLI